MLKKCLSSVLAVLIVFTTIPFTGYAVNGDENVDPSVETDYSIKSNNSFAKLISDVIESSSNNEPDGMCYISDVKIEDSEANIDLVCNQNGKVLVTLLDEKTERIIATGIQDVPEGAENTTVEIDSAELPDYYVVKATIVDESMKPIASEYVDTDYTEWYSEFQELETTDFDNSLVLNLDGNTDTNFAVFKDDVSFISAEDNTLLQSQDNTYSFQLTDEVEALEQGDVFCYNKEDPDNIVLGRIVSVRTNGQQVSLTTEDVVLEEVFEVVKINYDEETCDLSHTSSDSEEDALVKAQGLTSGKVEANLSGGVTLSLKSAKIKGLSGSIKLSTGMNVKIEWDLSKKYLSVTLKITPSASISAKFEIKTPESLCPKIGTIPIPTPVPGLYVEIVVRFLFEASISATIGATVSRVIGFNFSFKNGKTSVQNLSTSPNVSANLTIEGKVRVGLRFEPRITAVGVISLGFKSDLGVEIKGAIKKEVTTEGKRHDCGMQCVTGEFYFVFNLRFSVSACFLVWEKSWDISITGDVKVKISDFYWSIKYGDSGWGSTCTHYSYKTKIIVLDDKGKPISGATVDGIKTNSSGVVNKYYSVGQHTVTVTASGFRTCKQDIGISTKMITVTVRLKPGKASDIDRVIDSSVNDYLAYQRSRQLRYPGFGLAPLTYTEPAEGVVLSTRLAGQRRSDVAWVQRELKNLGYSITVDGYYGYSTAAVVRQFQQDYALPVTGTVNANVVAVIKKPLKPVTPPVLRLTTNADIPSGGIVTVAWDKVNHAADYNAYAYDSQGNLVASAVETKANTASFVLYEAGDYTIKAVSGNERFTSQTATLNQIIHVHNPSVVTFVDWDGTVLSKQFVEFGKAAVTPASPERDGYTFSKWVDPDTMADVDYTKVTENETTVMAQYTPNSYTVKFMDVKVNGVEKELSSDKVLFGEAAQSPDPTILTIPAGYTFVGWDKDYSEITEDTTVRPILEWANNDLPILIESYTVTKDEDYGYDVSLTIRNYETKRTTGRVVVALKTESGRFITMTESSAFTLAKSNVSAGIINRETFNIFVPCKENAAYVDLFVVAAYNDLIPISEVKRYSVGEDTENEGVEKDPITGQVDASLAGKQAILFIYKIDEAADYTNEYIGQTVIGVDGSYSFDYRLREEPTPETGDYTVVLGIEGANGAIFLDTIAAPRKSFVVTIKDYDGSVLKTQQVFEGDSATLPDENPEREGYRFAGWDYSNSSIHEDLTITAIYVPKTYTVVFIDWANERFDMKTYQHGEPIDSADLSMSDLEDYNAIGWEGVTEGLVVTQNMVITAKYEKKQFTVKFYDYSGNVIDEQLVPYGEEAEIPEIEEDNIHIFCGWDSEEFACVKAPLEIHPFFEYAESTTVPETDIQSGVYDDTITIRLSCATDNAEIYYSLDGGDFILYSAPIIVSQTAEITAYASSFGRNDSDSITNYYVINRANTETEWKFPVQVFADGMLFGTYLLPKGSIINSNTIPVFKPGYSLEDFYTDEEFSESASGNILMSATVLYARFIADTFTVQFVDADGSVLDTQTVAYMEAATPPEMIDSVGDLIFMGWDVNDYYCVTNDLTVTAFYVREDEIVDVKLNRSVYTMMEGYSYTLTATTTGSGITEIFWESSDEAIATVDENGKITAHNDGYVVITATALGETSASASCYVKVEANPIYSITLSQDSVYSTAEGYICGISPSNNTVAAVRAQIQNTNLTFYDGEEEMGDTSVVKTGCTIIFRDADGAVLDTMTLVVTGDVDGDGVVSNQDASHILRYIIGKEQLDTHALMAADANADGDVNNRDASLVMRVLAEKESI